MKPNIFIDTTKARNDKGFDQLLGNRIEIEKFTEHCDVILPSMVIDEIIYQKKKFFEVSKNSFTNSHLYKKLPQKTKDHIDTHIQFDGDALRNDQTIPYTTIDIQDKAAAFDEIRALAVKHEAPFEVYSVELGKNKTDNTDKGFKDAYIALTIKQYVNSLPGEEKVFVLIRDRRLEEYLDKNDRVVCVSNFDEFNTWCSAAEGRHTSITGTARIIPRTRVRQDIKNLLTEFRNSPNFEATHKLVAKLVLTDATNKFTDDDYIDILASTAQNNQISWLMSDDDVREFLLPIFKKYGEQLNAEQYNTIAPGLGLEGKKVVPMTLDIDFNDTEAAADKRAELESDIGRGHYHG